MKRYLALLLSVGLISQLAGCAYLIDEKAEPPKRFAEGSYTASGMGYSGEISVTVTLGGDKIEKIEVAANGETPGVGSEAVEKVPAAIVANQSLSVDAVAGASVTSSGIIEAVTRAIAASGADTDTLMIPAALATSEKRAEVVAADVVVIGAGAAGMTAALSAAEQGKSVALLEKMPTAGGAAAKAISGLAAADSYVQAAAGESYTAKAFISDIQKSGRNTGDIKLISAMAQQSAGAVEWLSSMGAPLEALSPDKRGHLPEGGDDIGEYLVSRLYEALSEKGVAVCLGTEADRIILNDNAVSGVTAMADGVSYLFLSNAVVVATGGFGADTAACAKHVPALKGYITACPPYATGGGIAMAQDVGAQFIDIEDIQTHPTVHQATGVMISDDIITAGAILINSDGARFVDETLPPEEVCAAETQQSGGYAYLLFDRALCESTSGVGYAERGLCIRGDTVLELADRINVSQFALQETLDGWNEAVASQVDMEFERAQDMGRGIAEGPFYAIRVMPGICRTLGGLRINAAAEVIGANGEPIPGLFAAGEVTGGIHGYRAVSGGGLTDAVVFGRQAGQSAAAYGQ